MVKQSGRSCPERGARHMGNGPMRTSILSLLLAGAILITGRAPLAYGERKLELRSLKDRVYRLESGPINRCPEKLGFQLNAQANELRSEEHTSEPQSQSNIVCRLLLDK